MCPDEHATSWTSRTSPALWQPLARSSLPVTPLLSRDHSHEWFSVLPALLQHWRSIQLPRESAAQSSQPTPSPMLRGWREPSCIRMHALPQVLHPSRPVARKTTGLWRPSPQPERPESMHSCSTGQLGPWLWLHLLLPVSLTPPGAYLRLQP